MSELTRLAEAFPQVIRQARGLGLMIGVELAGEIPAFAASEKAPAIEFINCLHRAGLLAIPAGTKVIRLLPALSLKQSEAAEAVRIIESVAGQISR